MSYKRTHTPRSSLPVKHVGAVCNGTDQHLNINNMAPKGIEVKEMDEFCDGCAEQFKSKKKFCVVAVEKETYWFASHVNGEDASLVPDA